MYYISSSGHSSGLSESLGSRTCARRYSRWKWHFDRDCPPQNYQMPLLIFRPFPIFCRECYCAYFCCLQSSFRSLSCIGGHLVMICFCCGYRSLNGDFGGRRMSIMRCQLMTAYDRFVEAGRQGVHLKLVFFGFGCGRQSSNGGYGAWVWWVWLPLLWPLGLSRGSLGIWGSTVARFCWGVKTCFVLWFSFHPNLFH